LKNRIFSQYKEQLLGQITMAQENRMSVLLSQTKAMLYFKKTLGYDELKSRVMGVTAIGLQETAGEIFNPENRSYLEFIPSGKEHSSN
jgi:predicted Zn-dependent peptidase